MRIIAPLLAVLGLYGAIDVGVSVAFLHEWLTPSLEMLRDTLVFFVSMDLLAVGVLLGFAIAALRRPTQVGLVTVGVASLALISLTAFNGWLAYRVLSFHGC